MEIPIYKEHTITWDYFVHKAVKGSIDTKLLAYQAEAALVSTLTGNEYSTLPDTPDLEATFANFIEQNPLDKSFNDYLAKLYHADLLETLVDSSGKPFHSSEKYHDLWHSDWKPSKLELVHDAALYCFNNWTYTTYLHIRDVLDTSQDDVVMMLFIVHHYL